MEAKFFTLYTIYPDGQKIEEYCMTAPANDKSILEEVAQRNFIENEKNSGVIIVFGKLITKDIFFRIKMA